MFQLLVGHEDARFRATHWPTDARVFRSDPQWFGRIRALQVFHDPDVWLDVAPQLDSFTTRGLLSRREARSRYERGESIYILGLDKGVRELREQCDLLADDLALNPANVSIEAWAAQGPTRVGMHYDLDYNFNVQVVGRKTWRTAPNHAVVHPVQSFHLGVTTSGSVAPPPPEDLQVHQVEPGDVVYLPQGTWHSTETAETTFAMAFVIKPLTWAEHVSRVVVERLHAEATFRARVLGVRNPGNRTSLLASAHEAIEAARRTLDTLAPEDVVYLGAWGGAAAIFERAEGVENVRVEPGVLRWELRGRSFEMAVPPWAEECARLLGSTQRWSLAAAHSVVGGADAHFLNAWLLLLVREGLLRKPHA